MLGREFRITAAKEYNNIYKNGKKIPGKYMIMFILENTLGYNRFGFVTSKKVGKAVLRNRIKRQLRDLVRRMQPQWKQGYDIVLVVRYRADKVEFDHLKNDLSGFMRKAKLWVD